MSDPYVGEIKMFCGDFAPRGWRHCDGSLLEIREFQTLFGVLGTRFGGDGQTSFALPDLRGRVPVHQGQGPSLGESYQFASRGGEEKVELERFNTPQHTHPLTASTDAGTTTNPSGNMVAASASMQLYTQDAATDDLSAQAMTSVGASEPHENRMPFLALQYIIATRGVSPGS